MLAKIGDWPVIENRTLGGHRRRGMVTAVEHEDGSPPFRVRRVDDDHESLVFPGPDAHIEPHAAPPEGAPG